MLVKLRDNIFIADANVSLDDLQKNKVTVVVTVAGEMKLQPLKDMVHFHVDLYTNKINKPHVKDIACHIPKYMVQNGEVVAIISTKGLIRAPFVACRAVCELEQKTMYEIMLELKEIYPEYELSQGYL